MYVVLLVSGAMDGSFIDTVYFDGEDLDTAANTKEVPAANQDTQNKDIQTSSEANPDPDPKGKEKVTTDYSNNSKWYVERMKFAYEQLMEHESKWLEFEKEEYLTDNNTKDSLYLPENSLHANIAEFREQDIKEMLAINEALAKFDLQDSSSSHTQAEQATDNKRSADTTDSVQSVADTQATNKKSKTE